ncbi:hypothetical protein LMG26858_01909 [Achromobacter anxifer]|uniref:Lipoprotein n=1 Tax=Achromobacter anxifer TaxID=1287737 RepID=A0A6S7CMY7_9BURK|nr:DUF5339 family protein [Achromobacter anxifer]CAB3854861.1 hypothetical protein LMG26858_01909 [Achromobacter anxifer]
MTTMQCKAVAVIALTIALTGCIKADEKTAKLPSECQAYLSKLDECITKVGSSNPTVASIRQQLEATKTEWAAVVDKVQLAEQCKQSSELFATQMGCK